MRVGYYCETEDFARMIKPENIFSEQDRNERVQARLKEYEDFESFLIKHKQFYLANRIHDVRFDDHFWGGRMYPSSLIYYFTHYTHLRDYCKKMYPTPPDGSSPIFYDNCALAHTNERGVIDPVPYAMYNDFEN